MNMPQRIYLQKIDRKPLYLRPVRLNIPLCSSYDHANNPAQLIDVD